MKVSLNWVREINQKYGCAASPAPNGVNKLVEKIGAQLGAVDEVIDLGERYKGILIVKVVSCEKHPNADKLTVCLIDDGHALKKVKRNKNGLIEIVCGAPNVKAGMLAVWIPPGTTVPSTFDKDPFIVQLREIRGVVSHGMLASAKELALGDEHDTIVEVDEDAKAGSDFAKRYQLDDFIIDIENKMFTHRPDCFGMLGIAREIAGIQQHSFKSPDWYKPDIAIEKSRARDDHKLSFKNNQPKLVPRFSTVVIKDVAVKASPIWLSARLSAVGIRPVNNIVDLTNFVMYETAQPLHAYDYDKVLAIQANRQNGVQMGVRLSKRGEELKLLGGKKLKLAEGALLITADDKPIGLGGVMGGANTEVDESTKNIILECANFDMNKTRQTAMHYGLFTDAATRFTKNQSPLQNMAVLAKCTEDIKRIAGGRVSSVIDDKNNRRSAKNVNTTTNFINARLGLQLSALEMAKLLENVEFKIKISKKKPITSQNRPFQDQVLEIEAPFWRTDIEIAEDVVEEVGRLYGYEHLPLQLPARDLKPAAVNEDLAFKSRVRNILSAAGANEVLTYSFVHGSLIEAAGQNIKDAFHIRNASSPDLQYYRLSLAPSLLEKAHPNIKSGHEKFVLYEIGTAHVKGVKDKEKLPAELERLAIVVAAKDKISAGAAFYEVKKYVEYLLHEFGIHSPDYKNISQTLAPAWKIAAKVFEPKRSAEIYSNKELLGIIGEPTALLKQTLKLPKFCAQAELDIATLFKNCSTSAPYHPLNRFPQVEQDLCLRSSTELTYFELTSFLLRSFDELTKAHGYNLWLRPLDIYQSKNNPKHKQTTWRIIVSHPERTLTTGEVNVLFDKIATKAKKELKAERI